MRVFLVIAVVASFGAAQESSPTSRRAPESRSAAARVDLGASVTRLRAGHDVKAFVRELASPRSDVCEKASQALRRLPPAEVTAEIIRAVREDPQFGHPGARTAIYDFLDEVMKDGRREHRLVGRSFLDLLRTAVVLETKPWWRQRAIDSLALVEADAQKEVADWITPALEDPNLDVVAAAARALGAFGSLAMDSAPSLLALLRDPGEATRHRWETGGNGPVNLFGTLYHTHDGELRARQEGAAARMAILGCAADFDLFPTLDEKGQIAGAMAVVLRGEKLPAELAGKPAQARQAIALVAPLLGNARVSRDQSVFAPLMIWAVIVSRFDGDAMKEVRAEALTRIEEAAKHADERVSKVAAQTLETLKKAK